MSQVSHGGAPKSHASRPLSAPNADGTLDRDLTWLSESVDRGALPFGTQVAADLFKDPDEVPKQERRAVVRCVKRHPMGIVTKDELLLGSESVALSSTDLVYARCLHPGCQGTGQEHLIDMDRLRVVASRWRRRPIDTLITEIATMES